MDGCEKDHTVTICEELAVGQIIKLLEIGQLLKYNTVFASDPSVSTGKIELG